MVGVSTMQHITLEPARGAALGSATMAKRRNYIAEINYVAVAVDFISGGNIDACAKTLGVSRETVYQWLRAGTMRHLAFEDVKKVADASGLDIEKLTRQPFVRRD